MRLLEKADRKPSDEEIGRIVTEAAKVVGSLVTEELRSARLVMLIDHASLRAGFETRLRDPWGEALDALYTVQVAAWESAEEHFNEMRSEAEDENDVVWAALVGLHARACHITSEIHALLRTGHAEAAMARWRTLHEVMVVAVYISDHTDDLATRYLEHEAVTTWHDARAYQRHAGRLGLEPYTDDELNEMRGDRDRLVAKYGKAYDQPLGWLIGAIPTLTFACLEEETELDHWRPFYLEANSALHAGSLRLSRRLGVPDAGIQLIVGPSNMGLEEAGINTALTLAITSSALLSHRANLDSLVSLRAILDLSDDAQRSFGSAAEELEQRIAEEEKAQARRERRRERDRARRAARRHAPTGSNAGSNRGARRRPEDRGGRANLRVVE